ncbi:DMT family transporter [Bacillus alkalisoli]|uniref:DMT family transporter n=1 Tax=Bacillus alkalisoli TaxID=2011008 RepID=UPI000C24833F|nr:DMT family transporter [Bacillus alkalisoli]
MKLYSALIGLSLIWGLSFVFVETIIGTAGVWGTVFLRCVAGASILFPLLLIKIKNKEIRKNLPWKALLIAGVFNAGLPWALIALSQTQITSNTAAVLNALTPILTGLIGFIAFSIFLNKQQWGGIILGFLGILILMNFNISELFSNSFIGIGTMILATTCYGFATHFTKRYLSRVNEVILSFITLVVGAAIAGIGVIFTEPMALVNVMQSNDWKLFVSIIGLGCVGSGIAYLLYYYLINTGGAAFASTVTYIIPLTALFWGNILLGEPVTKNLLFGLITIFLGVYFANRKSRVTNRLKAAA